VNRDDLGWRVPYTKDGRGSSAQRLVREEGLVTGFWISTALFAIQMP